jgi:hypothetical protein
VASELVAARKAYHDAIRDILLREWDPIGVASIPEARDEYDSYLPGLHSLIFRRVAQDQVTLHLLQIEMQLMELDGSPARAARTAALLLALPESFTVAATGRYAAGDDTAAAIVYVRLEDEEVDCWRPVYAHPLPSGAFQLTGPLPEGEVWQFPPGARVRCEERPLSGGVVPVAVRFD